MIDFSAKLKGEGEIMKKKLVLLTSLVLSGMVLTAAAVLSPKIGQQNLVQAGKTNYTLTIDENTQIHKNGANYYALTDKGNQYDYRFVNAGYDDEDVTAEHAICMLRNNGSGIYGNTAIQSIISFSMTFDNAGEVHVYFSNEASSTSGEDCHLHSGDVYEPTTNTENVYISIWSNITTYVTSMTIVYACE